MFDLATEYARRLRLHDLDAGDDQHSPPLLDAATDEERKSLWDLIGKDLFFRLFFDRPPTISGDLGRWRVNLPWLRAAGHSTSLSSSASPQSSTVKSLSMFLARSRLTFFLVRFFGVLESDASADEKSCAIYDICVEALRMYDEWPMVSDHPAAASLLTNEGR